MCRLVSRELETLVVSHGGVGTTFIMEFIEQFRTVNCPYDRDGLKHLPLQPLSRNPNLKVLYVFGDPVEAAASLFRRGYQSTQSANLARINFVGPRKITSETTIAQYASKGQDDLHLNQHFDHWLENRLGYSTLFIDYRSIWANLETLFDFLEIPSKNIGSFPAQKPRNTSLEHLDSETLKGLTKIYQGQRNQLQSIGEVRKLDLAMSSDQRMLKFFTSLNGFLTPVQAVRWRLKKIYGRRLAVVASANKINTS